MPSLGCLEGIITIMMLPYSLKCLMHAMYSICPEHISNCKNVKEKGDVFKYGNERSFAYELYRQWENMVEDLNVDMIVNAEVPKSYDDEKFLKVLGPIFGYSQKGRVKSIFFPDLVYHHSQYDSENQELICEIKTIDGLKQKNSPKLMTDLKKLAAYMKKDTLLYYPFKKGAFILVGGSIKDIRKRYRRTVFVEENSEDIYCITYNVINTGNNEYVPLVEIETLHKIVSD